jgi:RNA polymerase sigma-70 factor, ECF subfamily
MSTEEEVIIKNAQKGDIEAFEEIVELYQKMVYGLSYKMLGNPDDASEASQEVFIRVYRSISKFKFDSKFSTWIYRITSNLCLDIIRKQKNEVLYFEKNIETDDGEITRDIHDKSISVEDTVLRTEKTQLVRKAILQLSPDYRNVIILRDIEGESYTRISELLDLPEGTVKSRINRGRQELKNIILETSELFSDSSVKINRREGS